MSVLQLCVALGNQFFVELAVSLRTLPVPDQVAKNRSDEKQGNDQRQHSLNLVRVCDPAKAGAQILPMARLMPSRTRGVRRIPRPRGG
jgi:hypothetical protein